MVAGRENHGNRRVIAVFDVKVTKMVHEYGAQHGIVKYKNRYNQSFEVPVNWVATFVSLVRIKLRRSMAG